ncbi:hypothetical protein [Parageobacillus thermoglucosidasius]|uniref:hypothetical protein n=1 Tax=Parageobacillus thermoglucosidasius TaxID=1426 RepID=UPI00241E4EAE|nr:hypothetical protein [Parageobacillus thermoglucosidasius]
MGKQLLYAAGEMRIGKERNQQELDHHINRSGARVFEVVANKTYDRQEIRAIAEKMIAGLLVDMPVAVLATRNFSALKRRDRRFAYGWEY